ncbi:Oidioi.mRNA.OKI2018_I69.PAR.g10174.t1.cds [Oikopleura dioica]|uniref:Oidioi.mRNA.OKI2018_I69.PAR.g10174.t1.cds n=1 Tax=Oikopleura dioica TaxID=34765 RepID=A0ABN7RQ83_OIKDI|nr:Oidioi.mRNA.OKI2018_I69.PAR.g10174.t1.cds [Oikopleura dioica]
MFFDKRQFPFLKDEDIQSLANKGIENAADFLRASLTQLDESCNLTIKQILQMRDYFLQNSEFLRPPKLLPEDPEKIECLEEGINDYLEGGFTPGEIVLFSQHEGEHDMVKELMSEIMEEFSARFATCIGETLNSGLFLPKNDDALLNVNVYSLGTFAETLRKGLENLFYPASQFAVNKDAPLSFMHILRKIAKRTNLVFILNLQKTGTSEEVYRIISQKSHKEIYAEQMFDPWIALFKGKTSSNHEISLHLKLREKDEENHTLT